MEKNKETVKKSCSDIYTSKKVGVPKTDFLKNSAHLSIRSDTGRNKVSYISRSKNVSIPIDKKYNFYENEAKSFLKHSCEKCGVKTRPHLVVNSTPANSPSEVPKIESGRDLNGNVSFNTHPTLCNFATSVSEISTFNKVLSYQSNQHYEISISKSTKHKQRTVFPEQRTFNSKVSNSSNTFTANKFFSSMPNSTIRCHCSKNISPKFANTDSYPKGTDKSSRENIPINEKYNSKYTVKYASLADPCLSKDGVKLSDLPVFVHSNLSKDPSLTCTVDYSETQLQAKKHNPSKRWDQISVSPEFVESSKNLDETEKMMLFPALPSNNHCQQVKLNSSCTNSIPSELSSVENTKLESVLSSSSGNVNLNSSTVTVTVPSTIPQASYADVIRMSTTCSGVQGYVALELDKTLNPEQNQLAHSSVNPPVQEKLPKDESPQPGSSDWVILRLSQIDLNSPDPVNNIALTNCNQNGQNFVAPRPIVVSLEKPSFYNSSMQTCKNVLSALSSHTNLPPSDKKVVENDSLAVDCLSNSEKSSVDNSLISGSTHRSSVSSDFTTSMTDTQVASIKTDSVYSSPSSVSSFGDAFKQIENKDLNMDGLLKKDPPVIIMNSCSPPDSMSEISFGIDYDEMLKLCSDSCSIIEDGIPLPVKDSSENSFSEKISNANNSHSNSSQKLASDDASTSKTSEIKMSIDGIISVKGKRICWEDSDVDFDRSNHVQLAEYFTGIWDKLGKDHKTDSGQTNGNVQYYHEL